MIAYGLDLNERDERWSPLFEQIIEQLYRSRSPFRYEAVRMLLELGADPNKFAGAEIGPLTHAVWEMDSEMLKILLDASADPNLPFAEDEYESFLDYSMEHFEFTLMQLDIDEKRTKEDEESTESWLAYLDRCALQHSFQRPEHLYVLRSYGALSRKELDESYKQLGIITWRDFCLAANANDQKRLHELVADGNNLNQLTKGELSIFDSVISGLCHHKVPARYEIATLLIELGADARVVNSCGLGPMTHAVNCSDEEMVRLLLRAGANPNKYDSPTKKKALRVLAQLKKGA
jgi:ankyrin repeat protein